jgi:hypothetical protein
MNATTCAQAEAIEEIEALTDPARKILVEAWAMPEPSSEACSIDYTHGTGRCYLDGDPLCVGCVKYCIEQDMVNDRTYSVDVTR